MSKKSKQRDLVAKLEALYAKLPVVRCKGECSIACGPIPMTTLEAQRLRGAHPLMLHPSHTADLKCIYLNDQKRCSVYSARPMVCRAWGTVRAMSCMHGCVPDRWLNDLEFLKLAQDIERIGGQLVVTTTTGLAQCDSFLDIRPTITEQEANARSERVLGLRALFGGHIVAVTGDLNAPPGAAVNFLNLDKKRGD